MNHPLRYLIVLLTVSLFQPLSLRAQEAPDAEPAPKTNRLRNQAQEDALRQMEKANQEMELQMDKARQQMDRTKQQLGEVRDQFRTVMRRGGDASGPALVVRTSETNAKAQASLEEDLAIMSRILEKSLQAGDEGHPRRAMGINVLFGPGPGSIRSVYLEGYGALFLLNVNFPLLPLPTKAAEQKPEAPGSSTWEETRRELHGEYKERKGPLPPAEEYNEEKVKGLKESLMDALKNGSNIRELKAEESITVCVFGRPTGGMAAGKGMIRRTLRMPPDVDVDVDDEIFTEPVSTPGRAAMLVIRARKSDAEACAAGKLSPEEFRKRASSATTTCAADAGNWGGSFWYGAWPPGGFGVGKNLGGGGFGGGGGSGGGR